MYLDRQVWENSVNPGQTALEGVVWPGSTVFAIPSAPFKHVYLSRLMTKSTKWHVRPAKTQISLRSHPVLSVFAVHSMSS